MSSQFHKWDRNHQDVNAPLRVVLFTSRNKDNKGKTNADEFHERRKAFLYHLNDPYDQNDNLTSMFFEFVDQGCQDELSRMYVSCNARNPVKIKKELMHRLVDDQLGGNDPLTHMEAVVASIAAKKECAAEKNWFFDFDDNDEAKAKQFCQNIDEITEHAVTTRVGKTPHGFAVMCNRGFDIRKLDDTYQQMMNNGLITLKRDDLLCVNWQKNDALWQQMRVLLHVAKG